jgi:hypothetical protein
MLYVVVHYYVLSSDKRLTGFYDRPNTFDYLSIHPTKKDAIAAAKDAITLGSDWAQVLKPVLFVTKD